MVVALQAFILTLELQFILVDESKAGIISLDIVRNAEAELSRHIRRVACDGHVDN